MELDEAKKVLKECAGITKFKLAAGIDKVHDLQANAMNRLAELKNKLPHALAQRVLEQENDVDSIKAEIAKLKETLADTPLTLEGLTRLQASNDEKMREANRVIERHEYRLRYDAMKNEIRANTYTEAEIDAKLFELKKIANSIDKHGGGGIGHDFEEFVAEMQDKYKGYRISR